MASLSLSNQLSSGKNKAPDGQFPSSHRPEAHILTRAMIRGGELLDESQLHQEAYRYYQATNGFFPRPCPQCLSNEFFVPTKDESVSFGSRPLVCQMCKRWHHCSCRKVKHVEQISNPWFCSGKCRRLFCELECWSNRGEMSFESSMGPVFYRLATPSDQKAFIDSFDSSLHPNSRALTSPLAPIISLLTRSFSKKGCGYVCDGIMDRGECDGGTYALGLKDMNGNLTSALTFSVYSTSLPAQVSLVAVEEGERRKGQTKALFAILEGSLEELGIPSLVMEPPASNVKWAQKLGFKAMHPMDVARLHTAIPVAFIDSPVMEKRLDPRK